MEPKTNLIKNYFEDGIFEEKHDFDTISAHMWAKTNDKTYVDHAGVKILKMKI